MEKNFTPLHIESLYGDKGKNPQETGFEGLPSTIFLILATLTVLIISIVLFVLIQKNITKHPLRSLLVPHVFNGVVFHG